MAHFGPRVKSELEQDTCVMTTTKISISLDPRLHAVVEALRGACALTTHSRSHTISGLLLDGLKWRATFAATSIPEQLAGAVEALVGRRAVALAPPPGEASVRATESDPVTPGHTESYRVTPGVTECEPAPVMNVRARDQDPDLKPDPRSENEVSDLGSGSAPPAPADEAPSIEADTAFVAAAWNAAVTELAAGDEVFIARHACRASHSRLAVHVQRRRAGEGRDFRRRFTLALELARANPGMWGRLEKSFALTLPGLLGESWAAILDHTAAPFPSRGRVRAEYFEAVRKLQLERPELFGAEDRPVQHAPQAPAAAPIPDPEAAACWARVRDLACREGSDPLARIWVSQAVPVRLEGERVFVAAAEGCRTWIASHLEELDALAREAGLEGVSWAA